jgi:hypothetical protein
MPEQSNDYRVVVFGAGNVFQLNKNFIKLQKDYREISIVSIPISIQSSLFMYEEPIFQIN